jgi:hypothetical protein
MSALHSRLPDAGSIGPGIHSSSEGSVCGDLKLSTIFKICVRPIYHKTNIQAYALTLSCGSISSSHIGSYGSQACAIWIAQ